MVVARGDIYWADLPTPTGSEAGYRRPVLVVQSDLLNRSQIGTVVCIPLTANLRRATAAGNVLLRSTVTGLPQDSVASTAQILSVNRSDLFDHVGRIGDNDVERVLVGLDIILGRRA